MSAAKRNSYIMVRACCKLLPASFILLCTLLPICGCERFYEQQKNFYLEKGRELFNQGAYIPAILKFNNALIYDNRCADAMYMLGQCNFKIGSYKAAVTWFERAAKQQPDNLEIQVKIAESYLNWGRPILTAQTYEAILSIDPQNAGARKVKLEYLVQQGRLTEAEKLFNDLLKEGTQDTQYYKVLTEYYIKKNQYPQAVKTALDHFAFSKYWMKAVKQLIQKLEENENNEDLIKIYNMIIEQAPDKVSYQESLSILYRKVRDKEREEQLFQKLLQSEPNELQFKLNYVDFLVYYKQQGRAKIFLDLQRKKDPEEIAFTKLLINYYIQTKQIDAAVQLIQESLTRFLPQSNNYIELQNLLASIYFDNGNFDTAAAIAQEVVRRSKSNRDARFLLCKINLIQGDIVQVIGDLRLLIRENPNIAEFHYYLGLAHEMKDEPVLAEKEYREALNISPDYKDALKKWLAIYPMQGALTEVELRIDKYLRSNPGDKDIIALRDAFLKKKDDSSASPDKARQERTVALPGLL
jgi:tetratricopeptide (TPR) repeat protein